MARVQEARLLLFGAFFFLIGPFSWSADTLNLDELELTALKQNPEILAARAEWSSALERTRIDGALPDPQVGYDLMGGMVETAAGPQKNRLTASQEVPFPLKLAEKRNAAEEKARAERQKYLAVKRDVLWKLRKTYYELAFFEAALDVLDETSAFLKNAEGVARSRYASSSGSARDAAKAQTEVAINLERIYRIEQERSTAQAAVNLLAGQPAFNILGKAVFPAKPALPETLEDLLRFASERREEIREMEALVKKSEHERNAAQLGNIPDIRIGFEYTWVGQNSANPASPLSGKDSWMFPLSINLPLWQERIGAEIREAEKNLEAARAKLRDTALASSYDVRDAYARFQAASKLNNLYETAVLPQAQIALSADQAGYESGQGDFLNLLDSSRTYLAAKLNRSRFLMESLKAYEDLKRSSGLDLAAANNGQDAKS